MGGGGDGGMSEYYQQQQLELAKESLTEPAKSTTGNIKGSTASAEQAAALRRGIASTFNRQSVFSGSATSGTSTTLGS